MTDATKIRGQQPVPPHRRDEPTVRDVRGETTSTKDLSAHRRHTWLYEDLLA